MNERYLDVPSIIKSGYYNSHKRIRWNTKQKEYDEFTNDLHRWLKSIKLTKEESEIFDIVFPSIYQNLSYYLSHVYDFYALKDKNVTPIFSERNFYFDSIWNEEPINKIHSIELEKNRFKWSWLRYFYSKVIIRVAKPFFNTAVISQNELTRAYLSNNKISYLQLLPQYVFKINLKPTGKSKLLSKKIFLFLTSKIESRYFNLNIGNKQYMLLLIESFLARVINDLDSYNGFLKGFRDVINGTGGDYYNRLFSYLAHKEKLEVKRFDHGGERCFFNDYVYWENELYKVDSYYTYGRTHGKHIEFMAKRFSTVINVYEIAPPHFEVNNNNSKQKNTKELGKVLYVPSSFVGEARHFPYAKITDVILFDFQKYLIESLKDNDFHVVYKKHPKGESPGQDFLGNIADASSVEPIKKVLNDYDVVIFEYAGSAFFEAINTDKRVILIDTMIRDFNVANKEKLTTKVRVVNSYWSTINDRLSVDKRDLVNAILKHSYKKDTN